MGKMFRFPKEKKRKGKKKKFKKLSLLGAAKQTRKAFEGARDEAKLAKIYLGPLAKKLKRKKPVWK